MINKVLKIIIISCFFAFNIVEVQSQNVFTDQQIKGFIEEVFCNKATDLVFNNQERTRAINSFFSRISVELRTDIDINKKFENYLDLPLNDKYIKFPERDLTYTASFNPLMYKAPMFPKVRKIYRLGNTQYLLTINPLN